MPPKKPRPDLASLLQLPRPRIGVDGTRTRPVTEGRATIRGTNAPMPRPDRRSTARRVVDAAVGSVVDPSEDTPGGWLNEFVNPLRDMWQTGMMARDAVDNAIGGDYGAAGVNGALAAGSIFGLPRIPKGSAKNLQVTPKRALLRDSAAETAARVADMRAQLAAPFTPPPVPKRLGIVDPRLIVPDAGPNMDPLPVREAVGSRASMGHMRSNFTDENADLIMQQVRRGQQIGVGDTFYPSARATAATVQGAGGNGVDWTRINSGAAIRSSVPMELVGGSAINWALTNGVITREQLQKAIRLGGQEGVDELDRLALTVRQAYNKLARKEAPGSYGLRLMGTHLRAAETMLDGGVGDAYKIPTYDGQKLPGGVLTPEAPSTPPAGFVLDTHEAKGGTFASPFHRLFAEQGGFGNQEYGMQESLLYRPLAQQAGLSDRAFQANRWTGGGLLTGLDTPPNMDYAHMFEDLLVRNAQVRRGATRANDIDAVLKDIATGRRPFYDRAR